MNSWPAYSCRWAGVTGVQLTCRSNCFKFNCKQGSLLCTYSTVSRRRMTSFLSTSTALSFLAFPKLLAPLHRAAATLMADGDVQCMKMIFYLLHLGLFTVNVRSTLFWLVFSGKLHRFDIMRDIQQSMMQEDLKLANIRH